MAGLEPQIDDLIVRMMAKTPEERPDSAYEVAALLSAYLRELVGQHGPVSVGARRLEPSIAPAASETVFDMPMGLEGVVNAWSNRAAVLRELVYDVASWGPRPGWLVGTFRKVERHVQLMEQARDRLRVLAPDVYQDERKLRETRLQIGRALDSLAADEAAAHAAIDEHARSLGQARLDLDAAEKALPAALRAMKANLPGLDAWPIPTSALRALVFAGEHAKVLESAKARIAQETRDLAEARARQDDLSFQLSQLKGRMGLQTASAEIEISPAREEMVALEEQIREASEAATRDVEPLVAHYLALPHAAEKVRFAALPAENTFG